MRRLLSPVRSTRCHRALLLLVIVGSGCNLLVDPPRLECGTQEEESCRDRETLQRCVDGRWQAVSCGPGGCADGACVSCRGTTTRLAADGTCYFLATEGERMKAATAEARCLAEGGHLAVIHSDEENALASSFCAPETVCKELWIGLMDREEEGVYVWVDGSPLDYERWQPDEPSNDTYATDPKDQDCVAIEGALWEDARCSETKPAICELPAPGGADATRVVQVAVARFATQSKTFVEIPGSRFFFTPRDENEAWLVLFSARIRPDPEAQREAEVDYLLNGVPHGIGGTEHSTQDQTAPQMGGPWQHFAYVSGATEPQEVVLRLRDTTGRGATLDDLRVVAFPLPPGADAHYAARDEPVDVSEADFADKHTFAFTPARKGEYLLLALVNSSESNSGDSINLQWRDPNAALLPASPLVTARPVWQSAFVARRIGLEAAESKLVLQARVASGTAQLRYSRMLALRVDSFEAVESAQSFPEVTTTTKTPQTFASMTTQTLEGEHDRIVILSHSGGFVTSGTEGYRSFRYLVGGAAERGLDHRMHSGYTPTYGIFSAYRGASPLKVEASVAIATSATPDAEAFARDAAIHVLTLP